MINLSLAVADAQLRSALEALDDTLFELESRLP
jgi:hypothetical protein